MPEELFFEGEPLAPGGRFLADPTPMAGPNPAQSAPKPAVSTPETAVSRVEGFIPAQPGHWRISMRVTLDYLRWAQGLADHLGITLTRAVQAGLSNLADKHGYDAREPARFLPRRRWRRVEEVPPRSHG